MHNYRLYCKVLEGGTLHKDASESLRRRLKECTGIEVDITINPVNLTRSQKQNRYYWGVVVEIVRKFMQDAGNDFDAKEVHEFLKVHVGKLTKIIPSPDGEAVHISATTTALSVQEFEDYLQKILAWAAEIGLQIPEPKLT